MRVSFEREFCSFAWALRTFVLCAQREIFFLRKRYKCLKHFPSWRKQTEKWKKHTHKNNYGHEHALSITQNTSRHMPFLNNISIDKVVSFEFCEEGIASIYQFTFKQKTTKITRQFLGNSSLCLLWSLQSLADRRSIPKSRTTGWRHFSRQTQNTDGHFYLRSQKNVWSLEHPMYDHRIVSPELIYHFWNVF